MASADAADALALTALSGLGVIGRALEMPDSGLEMPDSDLEISGTDMELPNFDLEISGTGAAVSSPAFAA